MKSTCLCLVLVLAFTCLGYADIIHVPGDYLTIQAGIDAASDGDTVLVADGIYNGVGNKNLDFKGKAITVTSENGAETCIIDCEADGRGFIFQSGEGEESVVSGFTLKNGSVDDGGGILCNNSSPTITNNIITNNLAAWAGGGIDCSWGSSATITNNTITKNRANGHGGGGIFLEKSSPIIDNNIITNNSAAANGGGIFCYNNSSPNITNNNLSDNSADWGGGIRCYANGPSPIITNNIISGNSAIGGGGIDCGWWNDDVPIGPSLIIANNVIHSNSATWNAGISFEKSTLTIINNTIAHNFAAEKGGGIEVSVDSSITILNTILWGNIPDEIYVDETSEIDITYSDIQGGWPGEGNIDADPKFVDPDLGDYYLSNCSPCIGAGIMTPEVPDTDIEGNPRPNPPGSNPDMGAYETPLAAAFGIISGHVTDLVGNPLRALVIAINAETKDKYKTVTDADGYYEITDLEPGTYWVLCIKRGYRLGIRKAEVVSGEETTVNFRLRKKSE